MDKPTGQLGLDGPIRAVITGARGGVGAALVEHILAASSDNTVVATGRDHSWVHAGHSRRCGRHFLDFSQESSIADLAVRLQADQWQPNVIINAAGLLHDGGLQPERTWRHLSADNLQRLFTINATGPALLVKHLLPLLPRDQRTIFASLSARIGSIGDNRLGGWYGYRASKAAHNMLLKTASIEARRRWPSLVIAALHPGTVDSDLSAPFQRNVPPQKLFSPSFSAAQLCAVLGDLQPRDSGGFFAYDGTAIEW